MPLSEDEQRIIQEMERHLKEHDFHFVHKVESETIARHLGRKIIFGLLIFFIGGFWLISLLPQSVFGAFLGFLIMFLSAFWVATLVVRIIEASSSQKDYSHISKKLKSLKVHLKLRNWGRPDK